jgi:phosphate transport system substrate-binding protein
MMKHTHRIAVVALTVCVIAGCNHSVASPKKNAPGKSVSPGTIVGAGATFPAPLYKKWIEEYRRLHPDVSLSYDVVGSGEGVARFLAGKVDFGASDAAMSDEDMSRVERGAQLVPVTAGSIVLAYHLPDAEGELKLRRDVYVDIFRGKITNWNDPRISRDNPGLKLPDQTIIVVVRRDGSGTTFAFTNHLSAISETWRDRGPGAAKLVEWLSAAMRATGNEGVSAAIQRSIGSIGYVEYGFADRLGLKMASLENKAGRFISPSGDSGQSTLGSVKLPPNLRAFVPDPDGEDSYPIVTYSWLLLYKRYDAAKGTELKKFVQWCLTDGQQHSESLGYLRISSQVAGQAGEAVSAISVTD